jgi:hypothetical protein
VFQPGPEPRSSAVMCDIPTLESIENELCATDAEEEDGIALSEAAIALRNGKFRSFALDYANPCADGHPRKIVFHGPYPDGHLACLNCGTQIPAVYGNADQVCIARCQDVVGSGEETLPAILDVLAFCQANAKVSTNFDTTMCFGNACSYGGEILSDFSDPRRSPEDVIWDNLEDTEFVAGILTRTAATTGTGLSDYNAGAASLQVMKERDGWVEFAVGQTGVDHVIGLSSTPCEPPCDDDPGLADIESGFSLHADNRIYKIKDGVRMTDGLDVNGSHGTYATGERYRLTFKDNFDTTTTISLRRVNGACEVGTECLTDLVATHAAPGPAYPLRVDVSFREEGASLANVRLVYVK